MEPKNAPTSRLRSSSESCAAEIVDILVHPGVVAREGLVLSGEVHYPYSSVSFGARGRWTFLAEPEGRRDRNMPPRKAERRKFQEPDRVGMLSYSAHSAPDEVSLVSRSRSLPCHPELMIRFTGFSNPLEMQTGVR